MPSFVVYVNDQEICCVGLGAENTRSINIMWVGNPKKGDEDLICFHIGGTEGNENLRWSVPEVRIGDEIRIRIAQESRSDDPPSSRKTVEELDC